MVSEYDKEIDVGLIITDYYYSSKQAAKKINKSHATVVRQAQKGKLITTKNWT
ncbi:hypothetical protein KHA80_09220 [Anaerobacillus sp. HL2]|nr:hypothetical protein KHA80_09220 [Anaerobacillus sp. HL2]